MYISVVCERFDRTHFAKIAAHCSALTVVRKIHFLQDISTCRAPRRERAGLQMHQPHR
jgi:hypothetical protein